MIDYSTCPTCHQLVTTTACDICSATIAEGDPALEATVYRTDVAAGRTSYVLCSQCMQLPLSGLVLSQSVAPTFVPPESD